MDKKILNKETRKIKIKIVCIVYKLKYETRAIIIMFDKIASFGQSFVMFLDSQNHCGVPPDRTKKS